MEVLESDVTQELYCGSLGLLMAQPEHTKNKLMIVLIRTYMHKLLYEQSAHYVCGKGSTTVALYTT